MLEMIRRLVRLLISSTALVAGVLPTSADTVAATAITLTAAAGAWTWTVLWTQIVTAVGLTADTQITGFTLENFVGGAAQGEVAIAIGALAAEVEIGRWPIVAATYVLPRPIMVHAGTRITARYRTSTGAADTVDIKLTTLTGF